MNSCDAVTPSTSASPSAASERIMSSGTNTVPMLHLTIRSRLDKLKQQCDDLYGDIEDCRATTKSSVAKPQPLREFYASVQLWKERSLHHTLETLDRANVQSTESHIEAMEDHEKGARELFALTQSFFKQNHQKLILHLCTFADDLAELVHRFMISKLEEQRLIHNDVVASLEEEKNRIIISSQELQATNKALEDRLEELENAPTGGGDAIVCNKLRARVQHLLIRQRELSDELESAAVERVKHRRDLETTKSQLAESQKTLALTRAMNEKETRQLAAMVHLNHAQVVQILEMSRGATAMPKKQQSLERFDPLSGSMIVHLSPAATPQKPTGSPISQTPRRVSQPLVQTTSPAAKQRQTLPVKSRHHQERPKSAAPRRSDWIGISDKKPPPPSNKVFWTRSAQL